MKTLTTISMALVLSLAAAPLAAGEKAPVTLTGQVVCSGCWEEAPRPQVPYGTEADIACALKCHGKGIPQALAVRDGEGFTLYALRGADGKNYDATAHVGKTATVRGRTEGSGSSRTLVVESLSVAAAAPPAGGGKSNPADPS